MPFQSHSDRTASDTAVPFCVDARGSTPLGAPWTFASLLAPVTVSEFFSRYWNKEPLYLDRGDEAFYRSLISLEDIEPYFSLDEVFTRHSITTPREGYGMPDPPLRSIGDMNDRLLQGTSLRLRRMECLMQPTAPVRTMLRNMELELQHPKESLSCYVSPRDAAGLGPHHDETEIFTLQIFGSKHWRIYHRADTLQAALYRADDLGEPRAAVTLKAGDMLYVPRGWVHHVTSVEASFSLAIVFDPVKWSSVLNALKAKVENDPTLTTAFPAGVLLEPEASPSLRAEFERVRSILARALGELQVEDVVDRAASEMIARMAPPPGSPLNTMFHIDLVDLSTTLERDSRVVCRLERHDDGAMLIFPGGYTLRAASAVEPALRSVLSARGAFRVDDMHASLGPSAKLALAKRLLAAGLLRIV